MPSLREKFQAEKSEAEAAEASLREKLETEKLKAEQDVKLQELRSQINVRETQKKVLDEAILSLKEGYVIGATNLESLKKGKGEVESSEKVLSEADIVIEKLRQDFPDTFQAKGITNKEELLEAQDYQEEKEIRDYKEAEISVGKARESKKGARTSLRASVGTLRTAKGKIEESAPDVELSLRKKDRVGRMERLNQFSLALNEEIERLKLQTPEGQEAAKEKFNSKFGERLKNHKFLTRQSWGYSTGLVRAEDIGDSQKYGQNLVEGTLRNQVEGKLKSEIEQEKEKVGILTASQELKMLEQLPERLRTLRQKIRELSQKREDIIRSLTKKGKASNSRLDLTIQGYFGRGGRGPDFGRMLENDFARAYLLYLEKDFVFEQFYGNKYDYGRLEPKITESGVPEIASSFLEKQKESAEMLERKSWANDDRPVSTKWLLDPDSLEHSLTEYEKFLGVFADIVQNQPESIARMGRGISGNTKLNDLDLLRDALGYLASNKPPFQPLNIKSPKVVEGLNAGKSFAGIKADIKKVEEPFDRAYEERKEFLNRLIEKEWAEQEVKAFEEAHTGARGLQEKSERIKTQKLAAQELSVFSLKARELILSGVSGSENVYDKFTLRVQKANRESIDLTLTHPDFEPLRKKREIAEEALKEIRTKVAVNKNQKRPRVSFGKPKLDKELEALQAEEVTGVGEFQTADEAFKAIATLQSNLGNSLYPMAKVVEKGRFDIKNETLSVPRFLENIQKIIDDASSSSMSPEEEKILGEYSKLQQNALAKQTSHGKLRGEFSYEVIEQLQKVGWKESRS